MVNFDLQPDWLRRHEMPVPVIPDLIDRLLPMPTRAREFRVGVGGENFVLSVRHVPATAAEAFSAPAEDPRPPTDAEVLFLLARAFLGSLPQHPPVEPDLEAGWSHFRKHALETNPGRHCPPWNDLNGEWREAFACGISAALQPSTFSATP